MKDLDEYVKRIKIKNPITQEFNGTQGIYTQQNVEKQRSYNLPEWKNLTEETSHQPPAKRGERRRNQEKVVRGGGNLRNRATAAAPQADADDSPKPKRKPGRPPRRSTQAANDADSGDEGKATPSSRLQVPPTPDSPATKPAARPKGRPPKNGGAGQAKSVTSRRLNNTTETADYIDEAVFKDFKYGMEESDEYTPERCQELETHYWKSLGFNQPMYAADMPGSLFDDNTTSWNVAKLENLLDVLGTKVPGVNTAYLYMGMWKATFAWHLEDVDLYSINYIHFGAPKQWYSISQEDARKFEKAMKQVWPVDAKNCDQFLRHKTYLISPDVLQKQYGVKVNKVVHYEGEFVITFPYGYHSGYNIGYNCAESVNFATESWLEYGKIARKCNCEKDNVWVDVYEVERKMRGEPTPEYYEETDDDSDLDEDGGNLPSPPASVKGKPASKKRKRGVKEEKPKKKKKIRIRIKAPTREPCVMCPNDNPWEPLLPTETGKMAHKSCALFTPETWIAKDNGVDKVYGVTTIDKARLDLKCNFCRSKRGACFQCSGKKCTRAFHATCALAAGVQIDGGMVPTFGEDGTEYYEEGYDFRCKYHRPKMSKNPNLESMEGSKRINNYARELKPNDVVQAQMAFGQDVFAGLVVENRPTELNVLVDVLPEGYVMSILSVMRTPLTTRRNRIEVDYKWICLLDPDDSLRPKPSSNAIPMPEGMNKKAVSISNRQDGVPTQDQPFHDNPEFKWHDFYNMHMPPPGYVSSKIQASNRLKVDFNSADQLYYYLGDQSTEAKSFFTDKPGSKEVATKANFIERMSPQRMYIYQPNKQPIAARGVPIQRQHNFGGIKMEQKPYEYKPREPMRPNNMWGIDQQALLNQRNFLADSSHGRRPSQQFGPPRQAINHFRAASPDPAPSSQPLRAFPNDQYYSMRTLPAAHPGEYSGFTQAARRMSQDSQATARPSSQHSGFTPDYQSMRLIQEQKKQAQPGAPVAPMMSSSSTAHTLPPNPYVSNSSRPSSSAHSHQSPYAVPLTPTTTYSGISGAKNSEGPSTEAEYIANLQKYPYLLKSYLRAPKVYESPYAAEGGFADAYTAHTKSDDGHRTGSIHTPHGSISSLGDISRSANQQWTPPSQLWARAGFSNHQTPPPQQHAVQPPPRQYPIYSTPQEFQRQIQSMPSTASRDGAQARMLRDQGYTTGFPYQRNSFGQAYDTARMWNSPKAPTPSPLSDLNTPGQTPASSRPWGALPRPELAPAMQRPPPGGYGPMLPHMHVGQDVWKYK